MIKIKTFLSRSLAYFALSSMLSVSMADAAARVEYIYDNPGGKVVDFVLQKERYKKKGVFIEFHGSCESACTIFLSLPKDRMCVGPHARFGFHKPFFEGYNDPIKVRKAEQYLRKQYPWWVNRWLKQNGGLKKNIVYIPNSIVRKHIKECSSNV